MKLQERLEEDTSNLRERVPDECLLDVLLLVTPGLDLLVDRVVFRFRRVLTKMCRNSIMVKSWMKVKSLLLGPNTLIIIGAMDPLPSLTPALRRGLFFVRPRTVIAICT